MIKMTGFGEITRELKEAQKALADLDGELGSVSFNPNDPESIEAAIQAMEQMVDDRTGRYSRNSIIGPMAEEMKASYRQAILDKATEARLQRDPD
jgi:hypothetical protein